MASRDNGTNATSSNTNQPYSRTQGSGTPKREAVEQACGKASGAEAGSQAVVGSAQAGRPARAGAVQVVQAGMGGHRGPHAECAGHAVCLPVLPEIASCSRSGARIQEDAACPVGPFAPRGGIAKRW